MRQAFSSPDQTSDARLTDTRSDEQERGVIIKCTGDSLSVEHDPDDSAGLKFHSISFIDSPGHADVSSEINAYSQITDGAMAVVDCIGDCVVQTEIAFLQALQECMVSNLFVNKVDCCTHELLMDTEDVYNRSRGAFENANVIIASYNHVLKDDVPDAPEKGAVVFGSDLHGLSFNVECFAKIYASKMSVDKEKMKKRPWCDDNFNTKNRIWTKAQQPEDRNKQLQRAFHQSVSQRVPLPEDFAAPVYNQVNQELIVTACSRLPCSSTWHPHL